MSSGVGRGRGWLNLKSQSTKNPGSETNTTPPITNLNSSPNFSSSENRKFSDAAGDYSDLITKINQLNINDDGIKFNQKIKYIIESWLTDCENAPDVEKSFESLHQACLTDAELATKLVLMIASRTFLSQEIHEQNIRLMFLRKLQDNFESCVQLQTSNPNAFRNSVQMMGEFFNKARLANGQQFSFMATPLISYLEMLLESAQSLDLKLFTIQLYLNGCALKHECPEKIAEILGKVRLMLCAEKQHLPQECKLWALLALEVADNRFALLPADVHSFYQEHLGDHAMASFQGNHSTLCVQTMHNSKTFDSYQSNVNVLQVSTTSESTTAALDPVSPQNSTSDFGTSSNYNSSGFQSDTSQNSNLPRKENNSKGGKTGRPILGAGARLNKNRIQNDSGTNWEADKTQSDSSSGNWNRGRTQNPTEITGTGNWHKNKSQDENNSDNNWRERDDKKGNEQGNQKKEWEKKKTPPKTSKKGWEHDDSTHLNYRNVTTLFDSPGTKATQSEEKKKTK